MVRRLTKRKTVKQWGGGRSVVGQVDHLLTTPRMKKPGWYDIVKQHPPDNTLHPQGPTAGLKRVVFPEDRLRNPYKRRNPDAGYEYLDPTDTEFKTRTTKFVLKQLEFIKEGKSERVAYGLAAEALRNTQITVNSEGLTSREATKLVRGIETATVDTGTSKAEKEERQELLKSILAPYTSGEAYALKDSSNDSAEKQVDLDERTTA